MGLVFCLVADENRQKQGKEVEKRHLYFFNIISTFTSQNKLRDSTSESKKNFLFTSACFNEHHSAVAEKNAVPFSPCLCPTKFVREIGAISLLKCVVLITNLT
jgi:hypothetical protein